MQHHLVATALIMTWCAVMSGAYATLAYARASRRHEAELTGQASPTPIADDQAAIVPALVLGPLAVALAFSALHINLIHPIGLLSDVPTLVRAALPPAVVLAFASGLLQSLGRGVRSGYATWRARPFARVALAYGQSPSRAIRRVVLLEALAHSWSAALPWLFSELIVVEAVFNAPGVGLAAWRAARERDMPALLAALAAMAGLYALLALSSAWFHRRLGRRLASYA